MVTVNVTVRIRLYMYSVFGNGGFSGGLFVEIHFFSFSKSKHVYPWK